MSHPARAFNYSSFSSSKLDLATKTIVPAKERPSSNDPGINDLAPQNVIIDGDSLSSEQTGTESVVKETIKPDWTADNEQIVLQAQLGSMEKAMSAYTSIQQNVRAGMTPEAAERKFLRENRQETRPGAKINPVTSSTPVTARQFLENKTGVSAKLSSTMRVLHAKEDASAYKTPTQQLWDDYWVVRPTLENFESLVEAKIARARRMGQFDELKGKGKPLEILESDARHNPYLSDTEAIMNRMLKNQGHVPGWVELAKDIDAEIEKLTKELSDIWKECFSNRSQGPPPKTQAEPPRHYSGLAGKMMSWLSPSESAPRHHETSFKSPHAQWQEKGAKWADLRIKDINLKVLYLVRL
ncbi:hypothetical protein HDU96_009825 [Phlyctochytrium bullatum]|nr:hypothetical protein HDU96_009825 [Phlyctochytrium bullatum]